MYSTIAEFVEDWTRESAISLKVQRVLTDPSLQQKTDPEGRTLGSLAWHMVIMIGLTGSTVGLEVDAPPRGTDAPASAALIADAYEKAARSMSEQASARLKDAQLPSEISYFGRTLPMARILDSLIRHQIHHRAQMTVLLRQAGLVPPGVYGPSREESAAMRAKKA
ncbi:MAG TPA: DinB family protein [Spirochaetia bacterium]|nr:DinB family protein [Spirochaetia bacterium]